MSPPPKNVAEPEERVAAATPRTTGELTTESIRGSWPRILARVAMTRRFVWTILNQHVKDVELRNTVLWVTFSDGGPRDHFNRSDVELHLAQAVTAEVGATLQIRARLESEPIPAEGTAILSLAKPPEPVVEPKVEERVPTPVPTETPPETPSETPVDEETPQPPAKPKPRPRKRPDPEPEPDSPSEDDEIVENPADEAAELVMELFDAELVAEETTQPPRRARKS